jgi:starch synthase
VRGGGIAEIILDGQTGLLARVDDAADLARCIEKLILDKSLAQRFGDAGRRRALEMYSMTACADRVASVYEEVLHGRRQDSAAG